MSRTVTAEFTNMCMVYDDQGRVLVEDRKDASWKGISFPGGHVEPEESLTEAVIREIYEETGLTIKAPQLCGVKDWINDDGSRYVVFMYKTNQFEGEIKSSEEGEVFWVPLAELPKMELALSMELTLRVFLEEDRSEHFMVKVDGEWQHEVK